MKTWRKYRAYKRVHTLWEEYKVLAKCDKTKLEVKLEKLSAFLELFQQTYAEYKSASNQGVSLDSFYGDCSEVLDSLLDLVDSHGDKRSGNDVASKVAEMVSQASEPAIAEKLADVINKALCVAELILRDEKYKEIATMGPSILCKVLSLLENVESTEAKQLALRMVASIGHSPQGKLEIGRLDGFRKVLTLLLEKDQALSKEALNTLSHFLEATNEDNGEAPPALKHALEEASSTSRRLGFNISISPSAVWDTTKKVVSTVKQLVASDHNLRSDVLSTDLDPAVSEVAREKKDEVDDDSVTFPPSRRIIAQRIEEIELQLSKSKYADSDEISDVLTLSRYGESSSKVKSEGSDERMREFMCVQGALETLTTKLSEAGKDVQINVFDTISKLLRNSRRAQREFRRMDGYALVQKMFAGISDFSTTTSQQFLQDFFKIMLQIILDGCANQTVGNLDALELVFRLLSSNAHLEVRSRALRCIQEVIALNPLNVVSCRKANGFSYMLQTLSDMKFPWGVDKNFVQSSLLYRLCESVIEILSYSAVLLSRFDANLLEDITRLAVSSQQYHPIIRENLLVCTRDLLRDRSSRRLPALSSCFLAEMVVAVREIIQAHDDGKFSQFTDSKLDQCENLQSQRKCTVNFAEYAQISVESSSEKNNVGTILLEAIAHSISTESSRVQTFAAVNGFEMLQECFLSEASPALSTLGLWILLRFVGFAAPNHDYTSLVVRLLETERLSATKKMLVLSIFRSWLAELPESKSGLVRLKLRDAGAVMALISTIRNAGPTVSREAFLALGNLVVVSDKLKTWVESKVNFMVVSQLVIESAIVIDLVIMEVVMQLASVHHVDFIFAPKMLDSNATDLEIVSSSMTSILNPTCRFSGQLRSADAFLGPSDILARGGDPAARLIRRRNVSLTSSVRSEHSLKMHRRTTSASSNSSGNEVERMMAEEEDFFLQLQKHPENGSEDVVSDITLAVGPEIEISSQIWRYLFRNNDAAQMVLKVLMSAPAEVQRRAIKIIRVIMESNPANGQIFSRMKGISFILSLVHRCENELRIEYLLLLAEMGTYNIFPEETRLLFELGAPTKDCDDEIDEDLRLGIVSVVGKMGQSINPPTYFHFDGRSGWIKFSSIDRFPPPKTGYTMCCWVRVREFVGDESTVFRLMHGNGGNILELYFQRIGSENDSARCLSVRTHSAKAASSEPFAFNTFNARSFVADSKWHHVVFTQVSRTMSLYVDGSFIQSCSFTSYPCGANSTANGNSSKDRPLVAYFGGDPADTGGIRGDMSSISLVDGIWDAGSILALYEKGPLYEDISKVKGLECKPFLFIHPSRCTKGKQYQLANSSEGDNIRTSALTDLLEDVMDRFTQSLESSKSSPRKQSIERKDRFRKERCDNEFGEMGGWIHPHSTRCIQDSINDVGGMKLALRLFAVGERSPHGPALQALSGLLVHWEPNRLAFAKLKGFSILLFILSQSELTPDLFETLFEISALGEMRNQSWPLKEAAGVVLITDLLPLCDVDVQRTVLRAIEDSNMSSPESLKLWMETEGLRLTIILNFLRIMDPVLYPAILAILQQQAPLWTVAEIEEMMTFITGDQKAANGVHSDMMDIMYRLWASRVLPIDNVRSIGGFELCFCLLDHRYERIRCNGIKTIGLLLDDVKGAKAFVKAGGFDAMRRILARHRLSLDCFICILQLAVGAYRFEDSGGLSRSGSQISWSSRQTCLGGSVVHAAAIQTLLALLERTADEELQCLVLGKLRALLDLTTNAESILAAGGLDWCRSFLFPEAEESSQSSSFAQVTTERPGQRATAAMRKILGRLFVCGMFRDPRLLRLKELGPHGLLKLKDHEAFHFVVIGEICEHFEREPLIPPGSALSILKSLVQVLEPLTEAPPHSDPTASLEMVRAINRIANRNADPVRAAMKESRLLDVRDSLLVHCLRGPRTRDGAFAIMQGLSFEWVAERPAFREANGLGHLLHIFHSFPAERDLQIGMGCVLRNVFGPSPENRRAVAAALDDAEISQVLCPQPSGAPSGRRLSDRVLIVGAGSEESDEGDAAEESARAMASFLDWYYDAGQKSRREAVEARLNRLVSTEEQNLRRSYDRAAERRARRRRAHHEAACRMEASAASAFAAADERRRLRVVGYVGMCEAYERLWLDRVQERLAEGERSWSSLEHTVIPGLSSGNVGYTWSATTSVAAGRAPPPSPMLSTQSGPRPVSRPPSVTTTTSNASTESDRW